MTVAISVIYSTDWALRSALWHDRSGALLLLYVNIFIVYLQQNAEFELSVLTLLLLFAAASSLHASYSARHEPAGRRHRKHLLQLPGEYDDELQVSSAIHAQMQNVTAEPRRSSVAA